jgi:hypothetical protein
LLAQVIVLLGSIFSWNTLRSHSFVANPLQFTANPPGGRTSHPAELDTILSSPLLPGGGCTGQSKFPAAPHSPCASHPPASPCHGVNGRLAKPANALLFSTTSLPRPYLLLNRVDGGWLGGTLIYLPISHSPVRPPPGPALIETGRCHSLQ